MANYSNAQLIAFFKQWEPKVQYFGIDIVPAGFFKFYKQGRELVKAEAAASVAAERAASVKRINWTTPELTQCRDLYISEGSSLQGATDAFLKLNPNTEHSENSVFQTICQYRTLDRNYPQDTQFKVTKKLAQVAAAYGSPFMASLEEARSFKAQSV
jgi:hypothetical protein